jgi:beta-glucanase (GH16 family)
MTQEHPITPPPELVKEWATANGTGYIDLSVFCENIATQAARWGADQELEACCQWQDTFNYQNAGNLLRAARRPKPSYLKEQALALLNDASDRLDAAHENTIRRALESLPD